MKPTHRVKWLTFLEAKEKLSDPKSSLVLFRCKRHIVLPPRFLGRVTKGVKENLDSEVRLYCDKLHGALVGYDNVSVNQASGDIHDETPFVHLDIEADFIVFRPTIGCTLVGVVNKVGKDHIGGLVHNCFNASLPKPRTRGPVLEDWSRVTSGDQLEFEVTGVSNHNRIISISGSLKPNTVKSPAQAFPPQGIENPAEGEGDLFVNNITGDSHKKHKKKKKAKEKEKAGAKVKLNKTPSVQYSGEKLEKGKTKKSKKRKHDQLERTSSETSRSTSSLLDSGVDNSFLGSDDSVKVKKEKIHTNNTPHAAVTLKSSKSSKHKRKIKSEPS